MELFVSKIVDALRYHTLPYVFEIGTSILRADEQGFYPQQYFIGRFLDTINLLIQVD